MRATTTIVLTVLFTTVCAQAASLMDVLGDAYLIGYVKTNADTVDLAGIASNKGGQAYDGYAVWDDHVHDAHSYSNGNWYYSDYMWTSYQGRKNSNCKSNMNFTTPLKFVMTDEGDLFVGVYGQSKHDALITLTGARDRHLGEQPDVRNVELTQTLLDKTHYFLEYDGLISGGVNGHDLLNAEAMGIWNGTGDRLISAFSTYEKLGSANNQNHSKFYGDPRKGDGRAKWGPGFNADGTHKRTFTLDYDGEIDYSVVMTAGYGDNSNNHYTKVDGSTWTSTSSCCRVPTQWALDYLPQTVELKIHTNWSHGGAMFAGVYATDGNITSTVTGGSGNQWNVPTAFVEYSTGWNGDVPDMNLGGTEVPEPATMLAGLAGLAGLGRYLRRRR